MTNQKLKWQRRQRRHHRVRKNVNGTAERPRLSVYRSLGNIYAQVINDLNGQTLVASSTQSKELSEAIGYGGNCKAAQKVGEDIAKKAAAAGIAKVVFDRGGQKYHGRIKALAEAARSAGLQF